MSSDDAGYFGILPSNVRYDKSLQPSAKLLYVEITALCRKQGYCWATNAYFAELFNTTERTIKRWVKTLCDKGYCYSVVKTFRWDDGAIKKVRYICLNEQSAEDIKKLSQEDIFGNRRGDIFVPHHSDNFVTYNKINNELDNTLMDTKVSIGSEAEVVSYGKAEINQLFETWEATTGLPITSNKTKNRYACNNLVTKYGVEGVEKLIRVVERAQSDRYAPRVADFCDLQAKLNQLLVWAKNQTVNTQVISVEDF